MLNEPIPFGLDEQFRMSEVRRWHVINTTREQSLADHSFQVAMLTRLLIAELKSFTVGEAYHAMIMALTHDAPEVWMGDTPTCAKQFSPPVEKTSVMLYRVNADALSPEKQGMVEQIIKIADTMEALVWLSQNHTGTHSIKVLKELQARLSRLLMGGQTEGLLSPTTLIRVKTYVRESLPPGL